LFIEAKRSDSGYAVIGDYLDDSGDTMSVDLTIFKIGGELSHGLPSLTIHPEACS